MKIKSFILLTVLMIGGGCCDCDDIDNRNYYDVTGINADINIRSSINEKIDYDKLIIRLTPTKTYYRAESTKTMRFSFVNSAYACKCDASMPGWMGSKEQLSEIKIYSNTALNEGGSSSELLNQYFEMSGITEGTYDKFFDLEAILRAKPVLSTQTVRLRLKAQPTGASNHRFTIHFKLTNGESYIATTPEIVYN